MWTHVLSLSSAMSNPWEYREIMRAQFRINETRSVDEVLAEHKRRHAEANQDKKSKGRTFAQTGPPPSSTPQESEIAKARALMGLKD